MRKLSDYDLMLLIKQKQHQALEIVYDRYAGLVYSYALKMLRDETAARDIVQSVFLRLWTTESNFESGKGKFSSWLLTITRHVTIDRIRKERRERGISVSFEPEKMDRLADKHLLSPEDHVQLGSFKEELHEVSSHLSRQQMRLLDHFYWQGYSLSELAKIYDQPIGTVKSRLHQTLKTLRRHFLEKGEEV